jgi:hypothetical protein
MNSSEIFTKEAFLTAYQRIKPPIELDTDFLYDAYREASLATNELKKSSQLKNVGAINPIVLMLYIVNEYYYFVITHQGIDLKSITNDEKFLSSIVSISLDKYYTNEHLAYRVQTLANRFYPPISTLSVYLNFILEMISRYKQNEPQNTLIVDMMNKGFSMCKAIIDLLNNGFETEAFSTWRTLHETESILIIISKNGQPVINSYLKHMRYAAAFRGMIPSKEDTDKVFEDIKSDMKELDLKSKDMKRFIEYGWLTAIPNVTKMEGFKFNFRDGVERVAGLSSYSKTYEMSSEIAHSSPLMIYSKKEYFYVFTLLNLYESFFRIEKIFSDFYMKSLNEEEKHQYEQMRKTYYTQLISIHESELGHLKNIASK